MALLIARNKTYLVLAVLLAAVAIAAVWAAMAGADSPGSDTDSGEHSASGTTKTGGSGGDHGVAYEGPAGIWVNGTGKASAEPDIAVVSLGVEAMEDTAAEARSAAASAMARVISALRRAGVAGKDIQTHYFNISPRYQHVEFERCDSDGESEDSGESTDSTEIARGSSSGKTCYTVWENRLTGYSVSNQATVKVRNLDKAGELIDAVAEAAGDLVRINGVNFQIDDSQALEDAARANAVEDLMHKAEMLADLSGVKLGRLVHLSEQGAYSPPQPLYARAEAMAMDSFAGATPIARGELEVSVNLQGVFLIAGEAEPEETPTPTRTKAPTRATAQPGQTPEPTK